MNYKVIEYRCGCKYILITDPAKRIFKTGKCPIHWKNQESITLWCEDCGIKIESEPQAGHRKKWCSICSKLNLHGGRPKKDGEVKRIPKEPASVRAKRIISEVFEEIRRKYKPAWGV